MSDNPLVGISKLDERALSAISALDEGDLVKLERLLSEHPELVEERFACGSGYFERPYLLWFVAGNPDRVERLPANAAMVARTIIDFAERCRITTLQAQVDYTLSLVCSGRVPRESGVQLELIDTLVDAGADPNGAAAPALAHREEAAVRHLVERGAAVTLPVAVAVGQVPEVARLASLARHQERQAALAVGAIWGRPDALRELIKHGIDLDAYNPPGFHAHGTALHQAVASHSLGAVQVLVEAGASVIIRDQLWKGTALDWADYLGELEIASYLRDRQA